MSKRKEVREKNLSYGTAALMDLTSQLRASITSQNFPTPSVSFLTTLTTSRNPPPPTPSLLATAKSRILACDLSKSSSVLDSSLPAFPPGIENVHSEETKLPRNVHVQVVDVENLSLSRWEQIEELEAIERGERTRGREIIRVTAEDDDRTAYDPTSSISNGPEQRQGQMTIAGSNATHRLTLQDCSGKKVYAVELQRVSQIGVGKTSIGEKIMLKAGTVVARGTILLTPDRCVLLGGQIDAWHDAWVKGRLARLKEAVRAATPV